MSFWRRTGPPDTAECLGGYEEEPWHVRDADIEQVLGWAHARAVDHLDLAIHSIDDAVREIIAARSSLSRLHLAEPAHPVSLAADTGAPRRRVSWAAARFGWVAQRMSRGR